ncbi:MAG TPA: prenyltransferase/squalene oxidase repeat-containing protein, partial [Acidimicrobiales bacterium]|nr:prenyltransferase/squalene oxidase repeat-containing protein [Acidimicrobiales bacterium]
MTIVSPEPTAVDAALGRAADALRRRQHADGWWKGELETNVTIDAEDLLLRAFLGILEPEQAAATATWVRSRQRADGTWATFYEGPADLSTTVEAWAALRLAGDPADAAHMRKAQEFVLDAGGVEASRVFTRIWMALFGLWPWERLPVIPPELVLLPRWAPLNIYDFGCWARQTLVPLTIVGTYRPVRPLPFGINELRTGRPATPPVPLGSWRWAFAQADRALQVYERRPWRALRRVALARAEQWIVQRQEADGSWGGIQPPWVYSLIALALRGYDLGHPVMKAGIEGFDGFTVVDAEGRRLEACQSPVWDTALAATALADAGTAHDDPVLVKAAEWLLGEEVRVRGDWSVRKPSLAPGGWAFEFANVNYPDIDDTAEVGLALMRVGADSSAALERGRAWVLGMQSS